MNATTHPVAPEELMAFIDGELSAAQTQSISAHLESCSECDELAASLRKTSQALHNWKVPPALCNPKFEGLLDGLLPGAASRNASSTRFHITWAPLRHWRLVAASGVLATLVAWIVFVAGGSHRMSLSHARMYDQILNQERAADSIDSNGTLGKLEEKGLGDAAHRLTRSAGGSRPVSGRRFTNLLSLSQANNSPNPVPSAADAGQPMIARTVSLTIIAKDFAASRKSLDAILARYNGYAAGLNVSTPQGAARSLQASLRLPAPQLALALVELKSLGRVETESQNGEEVTQQHADLVARLKNSRETEQRLQAILVQRTGKISDVLEVEQEIARVRGEIEQMEAEQKNLEHRVDFATIDLRLAEEYKAKLDSPAPSIATQFHNALVNGYTSATDSLLGLLLFFVQYVPILLLWIAILSSPGWLLWRRWKRASAAV